jgi:hypothetical protein
MPDGASSSGEITPRNMVWVEDMPPDFARGDVNHLTSSYYTHAIVCFFHLDPGGEKGVRLRFRMMYWRIGWTFRRRGAGNEA